MKNVSRQELGNLCPICLVVAGQGDCVWCVQIKGAKQFKTKRRNKERPKPPKKKRHIINNPRNKNDWR
jgi:hypothetical protein